MIEEFVKYWEAHKDNLKLWFEGKLVDGEEPTYKDIVVAIVDNVFNADDNYASFSTDVVELDDGDYQGTKIFIIHRDIYEPDLDDYYYTSDYYGSCGGCDTLLGIYETVPDDKEKVKLLMNVALNLLQRFHKFLDGNEQ